MLRIGLIGTGAWAREAHLASLRGASVERRVVATRDPASAQDLGFAEITPEWEAVVARDDLDAILVCTPPATHERMVRACLQAGHAVYCDAPLAFTSKGAQGLCELAARRNCITGYGVPKPWTRGGERVRSLLRSGRIGEVHSASAVSRAPLWRDRWPHSARGEDSGPSPLAGLLIGLVCELLGPVERLRGRIGSEVHEYEGVRSVGDTVSAQLRTRSGIDVTLEGGWSSSPPPATGLRLQGSKGVLIWEWCEPFRILHFTQEFPQGQPMENPVEELSASWTATLEFLESVRKGRASRGFERAAHELQVVEGLATGDQRSWISIESWD